MLLYLCRERVLLHACGRRGVASTLSTCKGTTKFVYLQIFEVKSECDKYLNKNIGSVSPIKINKNQGDTWRAHQGLNRGRARGKYWMLIWW